VGHRPHGGDQPLRPPAQPAWSGRLDFGGITLYAGGTGNQFLQNVVEGSGAYAIGLASPFLPAQFFSRDNLLRGNQLSRFTYRFSSFWGAGADVLFDVNAIGNTLIGRSGLVRDLGQENSATGWNHRDVAGRTRRAGIAAKRSLLRAPVRPEEVAQGARRDLVYSGSPIPASPVGKRTPPGVRSARRSRKYSL
jgi:hypothetical protein